MKNTFTKLLSLALVVILCLGTLTACPGGGKNDEEINDIEDIITDEADDLKGIDFDGKTIWVGNTAATTGAMAGVGEPFNLGLQAAFEAYNKAGGYNGMSIKLKHYDDGGEADKASTLMDKLIQEDEIFAVVGHFGSYAVDATIDTLMQQLVTTNFSMLMLQHLVKRVSFPFSLLTKQKVECSFFVLLLLQTRVVLLLKR